MKLSHVSFVHPVPIPGTHVRQADFALSDGWQLEDDEGKITMARGPVRFHTYVAASCVAAPPEPPATPAEELTSATIEVMRATPSRKGKR